MERKGATVPQKNVQGMFQRTRELFRDIWNAIRNFLGTYYESDTMSNLNLGEVSLETLFEALTSDILEGRTIMHINDTEKSMLMDRYRDGQYEAFHAGGITESVTRVQTVADLPMILMNTEDRNILGNNADAYRRNPKAFAEMVYRKMYRIDGEKGLHLDWMGRKFHYPDMGAEGVKKMIQGEVLNHHCEVINGFPDHMQNLLRKYSEANVDLDEIIAKEFETKDGNISVRVSEIKRLLELMGGHDKVERIVRLSDLAKEKKYAGIIDASLLGMDPIVIIHEEKGNSIDLSISDITVGDMGFVDTSNTDNNHLDCTYHFGGVGVLLKVIQHI